MQDSSSAPFFEGGYRQAVFVKGLLADFYLGRLDNPQALGGRLDAKMWLYLIGAIMLALNLYSFVGAHVLAHRDDPSPGVFVSAGLFTFFLVE